METNVGDIEQLLASAGVADAAGEARRICAHAVDAAAAKDLAQKRAQGTPLAFVLGREPFMGRDFLCEPGVLAPRAVTSLVAEIALKFLAPIAEPIAVDVCSGSGNIGCTLALEHPRASGWCAGLMRGWVAIAEKNAALHGVSDRVLVRGGDLFAALAGDDLEGKVDVIAAAPPFISTGRLAKDRAHLLEHEPREAFDAGPYGLTIHQRLVKEAPPFLKSGGYLVCECGEGQEKQVRILFERTRAYGTVEVAKNAAGLAVTVWGQKL
jgi:release factor glutamine methyltransferase